MVVGGDAEIEDEYLPHPILRNQIRRCLLRMRWLRDKRPGWTRCQAGIALYCFNQLWQDLVFVSSCVVFADERSYKVNFGIEFGLANLYA